MFISHKYKVIFVHIQRTGGYSIQKTFQKYDPELIEIIPVEPLKKRVRHCFASDIAIIIDTDIFRDYTKFCVVRNPYDRMVSWYSILKHGYGKNEPKIKIKNNYPKNKYSQENFTEMALRGDKTGANVIIEVNKNVNNFEEFIMLPRNHKSGLFERFYVNQWDYISENNDILVDRILRFENLNCDFDNLAKEIGFEGKLPHVNKSKYRENYRKYYTKHIKEVILQRFEPDFEYFGYNF